MKPALLLFALLATPAASQPVEDETMKALCALALRGSYVATVNQHNIPGSAKGLVWCLMERHVDKAAILQAESEFYRAAEMGLSDD